MKKLLKWVVILAGIFVVLLVIASIALKIFFPAEKVKALVLKELTTKLNREVELDNVSLGVIKGLDLSNLRISESHTFAQGTFVSVDDLVVRVRLLPLLAKRVEIDTLVLVNPKIEVTRAASGKTFNFSDLMAPQTAVAALPLQDTCNGLIPCAYAAPAEAPATPAPVNLQISKLEIDNGQVHFVDHSPAKQSADISALNLKVNGFSMTDFFSATLRANIRAMGMDVMAQAAAKMNLQTAAVDLTNATITVGESKIEASGKITDYASPNPKVALKVTLDALNPKSFGALAALPPALGWNGAGTGSLTVNGDLAQLGLGGDIHLDNVDLHYGKLFVKPAKTPFSFSFSGNVLKQSTADIKEWGLKLGTLAATGSAHVDGLAQKLPSLSLHMTTNDFSTTDLLALTPGALPPTINIKGPAKVTADVTGTPASYKATAKISGQDLVISSSGTFKKPAGMPFDVTFKGESVANGQRLNIESLVLELAHLQVTLAGQYISAGQDAHLALTVHSNDFPLDDLPKISPLLAGYQCSGTGRLDAKVGNLMSAPAVDGTLTLHQANAKSAELQAQGTDARVHFVTPNALAPTVKLTLKTDGQVTAQSLHQTYYDGNALKFTWNLTDITEDLGKVSGMAQLNQGAGHLRNLDKLMQQSKIAKLLLMPIQTLQSIQAKGLFKDVGLPSMQNIPFDSLHADNVFQTGTMTIRAFDLNGQDLTVNTTGTIGLAGQQPLNLRNQMKLAKGSVGGTLGQLIQDDQGRPTIKFTVTGTADNPQVKLDLQEAGQKAVKQLGQQLLNGVSGGNAGDALNNIGNNLKNLFK